MSAPDRVTFDMLDKVIAGLDRNRINPMDSEGSCLYTSEANPDDHCIVGQIWHELGLPVPGPNEPRGADAVIRDSGRLDAYEIGAVTALRQLQATADDLSHSRQPWGKAIDAWPMISEAAKNRGQDDPA